MTYEPHSWKHKGEGQLLPAQITRIALFRYIMKVFFNHVAKCGGTSINTLAKQEYGENYHVITGETPREELGGWLSKKRAFITSEIAALKRTHIELICQAENLKKIFLARKPLQRFESLCGHSTRDTYGETNNAGMAFWGNEHYLDESITADAWLHGSIERLRQRLLYGERKTLMPFDSGLIFGVYSQWWLATLKSGPDANTGPLFLDGDIYKHISMSRTAACQSGLPYEIFIANYLRKAYSVVGTTEKIELFHSRLVRTGIFSSYSQLPQTNSSASTRERAGKISRINDPFLKTSFLAIAPEDFYVHNACSQL
jgi:hypothetical protein